MVYFTELQKHISKSLYFSPKTTEELRDEFQAPLPEISKALAGLIKIGFVEQRGHPAKFHIKEEFAKQIKPKPDEEYELTGIKVHAVIETAAFVEDMVKPSLEKLLEKIKEAPNFVIHDAHISDVVKEGERFSAFLDLTLSSMDFRSLVAFIFLFGPSVFEVLSPSKIEIALPEFQNGMLDLSEYVQAYVQEILNRSNRQELETFNKSLMNVKKAIEDE
ncbi:MAG: hypothetical protein JXA43_00290 [Candidatus Diapherotrites archaeon]|nr:hypothetical protein [Candidatus Diapherotrites archaeon]